MAKSSSSAGSAMMSLYPFMIMIGITKGRRLWVYDTVRKYKLFRFLQFFIMPFIKWNTQVVIWLTRCIELVAPQLRSEDNEENSLSGRITF